MNTQFDILKRSKAWMTLSAVAMAVSLIVVVVPMLVGSGSLPFGLNPGLDFTGGTQLRLQFVEPTTSEALRAALGGVSGLGVDLSSSAIHAFPDLQNTLAVRMQLTDEGDIDRVVRALEGAFPGLTVASREVVGGQVSKELVTSGWQSTLLMLVVILLYLTWRFQFRYAVGAVVALVHDVVIALGVFAILRVEINLPVIAAFLTIVGYSVNDTIVIFDRIRENFAAQRRADSYQVINHSINQSLKRTVHTSLTTLIPVLVLTFFGGSVLFAFALALLLGVVIGTYSSVFVASPLVHMWSKRAAT